MALSKSKYHPHKAIAKDASVSTVCDFKDHETTSCQFPVSLVWGIESQCEINTAESKTIQQKKKKVKKKTTLMLEESYNS